MRITGYWPEIAAVLLGCLTVLGFAPTHLDFLPLLCPILLFLIWRQHTSKRALLQGFCYGLGLFGVGVSWVFISIYRFGDVPIWLSGLITFGFICILALFPALNGWIIGRCKYKSHPIAAITLFPATWVSLELLRSYLFGGFPWLVLGYSQTESFFAGYAPLISVYGISLLMCFTAGCFACLWLTRGFHQLLSLCGMLMIPLLGFGLSHIQWTQSYGLPIHTAIVQGNISQQLKWDPKHAHETLNTYQSLTKPYIGSPLIFWPENAIPMFADQIPTYLEKLNTNLKQNNASLLTGMPIYDTSTRQYYNGAKVYGQGHGQYLKRHLVPFGEFIPLSNLLGSLLEFMDVPMSNFSAGQNDQALVEMHHELISILICYESAFAMEVKDQLKQAKLIAILSDDAWFGNSLGPHQHEQINQMRALETGRYIVTATNNGLTSIIKPNGEIAAQLPQFKAGVLTGNIEMMHGITPWVQYGLWPLVLMILLLVGIGGAIGRKE